jgi:predicted ATPase/DNA-binding SARP family transcriptional activator
MEFEILGPLRVNSKEGALELGTPAQRGFLAVLLTSPNLPVSDDRLIDELWGEDPPASAHHLLQVYVSRLRTLLGEGSDGPRIVREGTGYALRLRPKELDAERFLAAVARGRELQDHDPEAADRILARAMRLWRSAPFADLPDAPPAVREQAGYLERQHLEALETWVDVRLRLGRQHELVPELAGLVAHHPYDEALHAQLMLALYRCGRQAEALETARALETRLREELGIDLSSEVRDLYRDILLQAAQLALEPPEPPSNLPRRLTSFVGRERELREVAELLEGSRLVTLTGPGGIGKTRLAIEVAEQLRARFPGGVWWLDLAPVTDPDTVLDEVAGVLGITATPGPQLVEAVARALSRQGALLLVDNCEHVATAVAGLVAAVLRATAGPRVLATSRTPLRIEGERLWRVPPLSLPAEASSAAELTGSDAVRLFVERGRAVDPSFVLDAGNATAVAEVCRRLDGVSLAIEMAAARLAVLTAQEIVQHLDERFALLELPAVGRLTRHRTLEAAIAASHALLSEEERTVFERLSVFAVPFDLDAAAAVGLGHGDPDGRVLAVVTALVDASLLTPKRDGEQMRYSLLETLREYGATRLRERGGEQQARQAHADYHLDLAAQAGVALGTPDFAPWMHRLAQSYAELRQALAWSLAHQPRAVTLRAAPALREFWIRRGDPRDARRWTGRMLEGDLEPVPPSLLAEVHIAACFAAVPAPDLPAAVSHADEAVRLSREGGYTHGLVTGLWAWTQVAFALGDLDSMRRCAIEALAICDRLGDRWGRAGPLTALGLASLVGGGSPEEARAWFEEALPLYRELGDLGDLVVMTLAPLTAAALRQNDLQAAERYASEALELASGTGWEAAALVCYSEVLTEQDDLEAAEAALVRALRIALRAGLENWFRMALRDLARTAAERDRSDDAALLLAASRHNMPAYGLDPNVYGPIEERCRHALGHDRFDELAAQGDAMTLDQLMNLAGADDLQNRSHRRLDSEARRGIVPSRRGPT